MPAIYETFGNEAQTQLNGGIDASQTLIEVDAAGAPWPSYGQFRIRIDDELMIVVAGAGTTLWTVIRDAEGTTAATHADNALVTHVVTSESLRYLKSSLWMPVNNGLQASTIAVDDATGGVILSAEVNYIRAALGRPLRGASKVYVGVTTAGNTLTHGWIAIYDFDGTTKLADATGLTTVWQSTGLKTHTLSNTIDYDGEGVIVALNAAGTTRPTLGAVTVSSQITPNVGPNSGTYVRCWRGSGALTTPPAAVQGNTAGINTPHFVGIE